MIVCTENFSSESLPPFAQLLNMFALVPDISKVPMIPGPWQLSTVSSSGLLERFHIVFGPLLAFELQYSPPEDVDI